ncbi:MAG: alpha/beta hydrolase [Anaerolineales bacterium]|nr:alpha/beta hydrolase [Anaerolineales bacterium]
MRDWRYWRNLLLFGVGLLAVGLGGSIARLAHRSAMNLLQPARSERQISDTPARLGVGYQEITLTTADGLELAGWYTPASNGAVILVAHGYGGARQAEKHAFFARSGFGTVTWDFRAHGESEGEVCTMGHQEAMDVEAALDFALSQPDLDMVGALGESMGAAAIIQAAARRPEIAAMVADSSFAALEEEIEIVVPQAILRPFIRFFAEREAGLDIGDLRPIERIGEISPRPVFIIQGMADSAIPADSAQRLYDAAGEPRRLWIEPGVEHMGVQNARPAEYERRVIEFFTAALLSRDQSGAR